MAESPPRYRAILTNTAFEMEAKALAKGSGIVLTQIAVGDANNEYIEPEPETVALLHEVWRAEIDAKDVDPDDPNITNVMVMIPAHAGGFWIREVGVYGHIEGETEEFLYIYANHAPYYKMLPADGQSVTHELIIPVVQSGNANLTIQVADLGYVSRVQYGIDSQARRLLLAELQANALLALGSRLKLGLCAIKKERLRKLETLERQANTLARMELETRLGLKAIWAERERKFLLAELQANTLAAMARQMKIGLDGINTEKRLIWAARQKGEVYG